MSSIPDTSLAEQRLVLRRQMAEQRLRINHLVDPASGAGANNQFPRSMAMRLITQHPAGTLKVASQVAMLLFGTRMIRSLSTALNALATSFSKDFRCVRPRQSCID